MGNVSTLSAILAFSFLSGCGITHPGVHVERTQAGVTVHCEHLGEYPSDVGVIELKETATARVVWRLEPSGELIQLHRFELVPGKNPSIVPVFWGKPKAVVPPIGPFVLARGTTYEVSVCAPNGLKRCGRAEFTL